MTTEPYYEYFIKSKWPGRMETPAAIGAKFVNMLDAMSRLNPILNDWKIADFPNPVSGDIITDSQNIKGTPLASARLRIAEIVENYVARDDFYEPEPGAYRAFATTSDVAGPRVARISVNMGGEYYDGGTDFGFGNRYVEPPDLTVVTYPLFKAVLLAINAVWRAPWACAQAFRSGTVSVPNVEVAPGVRATRIDSVARVPLDPAFPDSIFHIPWIAYLSAEHANGVVLPNDILAERTVDGGLLMSATTEQLDPTNSEHVRRARQIAEVMISCFDPSSGLAKDGKV